MDGTAIDRVAGMLAGQTDRRSASRLLAAALLGGVTIAGADGSASARKRRAGNDRCRGGKVLDRVQVPADGSVVETGPLAKGVAYRLRVSGAIADDEWGIDGEYYFLRDDPRDRDNVYDACFDDTPVGLLVDGVAFDGWGQYAEDHVYERRITGKGDRLKLRLGDCYHPGNTGSLKVEVLCA